MRSRHFILFILTLLVLVIRFVPGAGEFYALLLYPHISAFLSWISSFVPFSLDELVALAGIILLIVSLIKGIKEAWRWYKTVGRMAQIILWYVVWFYLGWGCNYFRDNFYVRMEIVPAHADKEVFMRFANDYAAHLNVSWEEAKEQNKLDQDQIITEVKTLYTRYLPPTSGLCTPKAYQYPKEMLLNPLYSAAGVLGFMGPWVGENLLNAQLLPVQYPSIYAHELSHLLGVNNEAEANYWAYYVCTRSELPEIRYSGYQGLLPYVLSDAMSLLSEEEYREYFLSIRPEIIQERREISAHWQAQRIEIIDEMQNFLLDLQLKGNNIPSGTRNYNQVVSMIISVQESTKNGR